MNNTVSRLSIPAIVRSYLAGANATAHSVVSSTFAQPVARPASRFGTDRNGNVGMMFALTLLPVMMATGASIDYGRVLYVKRHMQEALDAAVLAGGRQFQTTGETAAASDTARGFFEYRFASGKHTLGEPHLTDITIDTTAYKISAQAEATVPTPFLAIAGVASLGVAITSQSGLALGGSNAGQDLEVSLMIDVTGSMSESTASGNTKLADAKLAAKDLIDILMPTGYAGGQSSRIALVPFSQYVNVGAEHYKAVTNYDPPGSGSTCVTERTGAQKYTDAAPAANAWIGRYTINSNHGTLSCAPTAELIPLTTDKALLKGRIDSLTAAGWTAGHLGTAWAWYVLSDQWASVWPAGSIPAAPSDKLLKVAVLMTDGDYNTYYRNGTDSQTQAQSLCSGMKQDGVIVYTIAFGTDISAASKAALESCASSAQHFYPAADGDQLRAAFRTIAFSLSQLRLTQ